MTKPMVSDRDNEVAIKEEKRQSVQRLKRLICGPTEADSEPVASMPVTAQSVNAESESANPVIGAHSRETNNTNDGSK